MHLIFINFCLRFVCFLLIRIFHQRNNLKLIRTQNTILRILLLFRHGSVQSLKDLEDFPIFQRGQHLFNPPATLKGISNQNGFRIKHEFIEDSDGDRACCDEAYMTSSNELEVTPIN